MKKKSLSFQMARGIIVLLLLITLIFFLLAAFAVFYHNKNATNGYQLRVIEEKRAQIVSEIETLEMQIADLSSLSNRTIDANELSQNNKVIYLNTTPSQ